MLTRLTLASKSRCVALHRAKAPSLARQRPRSYHTSRKLKDSVYVFGDNTDSQCAQYVHENFSTPQKISEIAPSTDIEDVVCSWKSTFVKQTNSQILAWGHNNFTQLCLPDTSSAKVVTPMPITALGTTEVRVISPGRAHTAFLISTPAQVITVGFAEAGCIGTGTIAEQAFPWPQVVSTLDHCEIVDLKTGLDHTVALNSRGEVWAWGMNASGQLGVGPTEDPCIALPMKAEGLPALTSIFAGADHSGGVDVDGNLWVWGSNWAGQLGIEDVTSATIPRKSNWDASRKIKHIAAGGHSTTILTESGEVWVAGRGDEGSLGLGESVHGTNVATWTKLDFFEQENLRIKSLSSGFGHVVVLTEDQRIFAWGLNEVGQLGLGDKTNRFEPTHLPYFDNLNVKGVSCGEMHTVVWSDYNIL